jgi:hypothetical protein
MSPIFENTLLFLAESILFDVLPEESLFIFFNRMRAIVVDK